MNENIDISIVIPFHNEEESLKELLPLLMEKVHNSDKNIEILLVDDASDDNGLKIAKRFDEKHSEIRLFPLEKRSGQTGCYKKAFAEAAGKYIIRMDGDMQDDPRDLPKFFEKIDEDSDLIMGVRECRKHPKIIKLVTGLYDLLVMVLFDSPLHSNSGSFVAFKAKYMKNIPFRKNDHRYLPLIAMRRGAKNISEMFVTHNERRWGESKYKPFKKVVLGFPEVIRFLIRYYRGVYDF